MRKHYLTSAAAIALTLGVTAAPAQNVDPRTQPPPAATSGQPQQGAPGPGQNQQQGAQPQQGAQGSQEHDKQQNAEADQADKSGLITVDAQDQTRIGDIIRQQRIRPATRVHFPLTVAGTVPSSVRLSPISGELADIFPNYRDFRFFVTKQQLVIVDPQSNAIVGFVPISAPGTAGTAGAAPPRASTGTVGTAEPAPRARRKRSAGAAPARENSGTVGTAEPAAPATSKHSAGAAPAPAKAGTAGTTEPPAPPAKKTVRTRRKRDSVVTEDETGGADERRTLSRRPAQTEPDATVGTSRRVYQLPPPPDPGPPPPPVREPYGHGPFGQGPFGHDSGIPFPFSFLFGGRN